MDLKNKTVLITGASSGIGKACAEAFAKRGANVVLAARQYVALCQITEQLEKDYNVKALAVACDVAKEADCENVVKQTLQTFGRLDVLVNNAGISMRALFKEASLDVIRQVMDINFYGAVYCTKYALTSQLERIHSSMWLSTSSPTNP